MMAGRPRRVTARSAAEDVCIPATELEELQQALAEARSAPRHCAISTCGRSPSSTTSASGHSGTWRNASRYGLEKFAAELCPVLDSLEAAIGERRPGRCQNPRGGAGGDAQAARQSVREAECPADRSARGAVRSGASRGGDGAALQYRRARSGAPGSAARLRTEWAAAAPGARHRGQGIHWNDFELSIGADLNAPRTPKVPASRDFRRKFGGVIPWQK